MIYSEVIQLYPNFANAYIKRGEAYIKTGDYHNAVKDFSKALVINPQLAITYFDKGQAYEKLGERQLAINSYRKFLELATPDQQSSIDTAKHRLKILELSIFLKVLDFPDGIYGNMPWCPVDPPQRDPDRRHDRPHW